MKLFEVMQNPLHASVKEWMKKNRVAIATKDSSKLRDDLKNPDKIIDADGNFHKNINELVIGIAFTRDFEWPFKKNAYKKWMSIHEMNITDFVKFPNVQNLQLYGCKMKSLAGIDKITGLKELTFGFAVELEGGMLRLLKTKIKPEDVTNHYISDDKFAKALKIVLKHMGGDRDLLECQNELIEADLEEYAKL